MHDPAGLARSIVAFVGAVSCLSSVSCRDPEVRDDGRLRFADGTEVIAVHVEPQPIEPGGALEIVLEIEGDPPAVVVGLAPPLPASRQVARGGPGAPPVEVEPDPRERTRIVEGGGRAVVVLDVPMPWHPRTAVVTLEVGDGQTRVEAVSGPRTHAGLGIAAVLPVRMRPTTVRAVRAASPPTVDGVLDDAVWTAADAHALVESREGEPGEGEPTIVRFAWDPHALYVAAELPDHDVWSSFTEQDDPLWKEEVFELFVFGDAGRRDYLELQVSPRGVTFDARFSGYRKGDEAWDSGWTTAVIVDGTLDDRRDRDRGWTAEVAVPWKEICAHTPVSCPLAGGATLRLNAFRLDRPPRGNPIGLALSPTRVPDFHAPENAAILELVP